MERPDKRELEQTGSLTPIIAIVGAIGVAFLLLWLTDEPPDPDAALSAVTTERSPSTPFRPDAGATVRPFPTSPEPASDIAAADADGLPAVVSSNPPRIDGLLADGTPFIVTELVPGVLCAVIGEQTSDERCHHELVTASGAMTIDTQIIFGYLPGGASSAAIRYRTSDTSGNLGVRVEPNAGFFAVPIRSDDPYRLQYKTAALTNVREVPLVPVPAGASQSPEAATRDRVPAALAELPFIRRVTVIDEWTHLDEGPYATSRASQRLLEPCIDDPAFGPACAHTWYELLLLDPTGTVIERSTPLPGVRPTTFFEAEAAVYVMGRQLSTPAEAARAELPSPPIVIARVDRTSGESTVKVFPSKEANRPELVASLTLPHWTFGPTLVGLLDNTMGVTADGYLTIPSTDGIVELDAATLDFVRIEATS